MKIKGPKDKTMLSIVALLLCSIQFVASQSAMGDMSGSTTTDMEIDYDDLFTTEEELGSLTAARSPTTEEETRSPTTEEETRSPTTEEETRSPTTTEEETRSSITEEETRSSTTEEETRSPTTEEELGSPTTEEYGSPTTEGEQGSPATTKLCSTAESGSGSNDLLQPENCITVLATSKNFMAALSMKLIGVGVVIVILVLLSIIAVVCFTMARKEYNSREKNSDDNFMEQVPVYEEINPQTVFRQCPVYGMSHTTTSSAASQVENIGNHEYEDVKVNNSKICDTITECPAYGLL